MVLMDIFVICSMMASLIIPSIGLVTTEVKRLLLMFYNIYIVKVRPSWLSGWRTGMGILFPRGTGSIPVGTSYLVWDGGQLCDSVSSARVDPALNGYLEKSGEGKQEVCE